MKRFSKAVVLLVASLFLVQTFAFAADQENVSVAPKAKNGAKWRIGYNQGGEYPDYRASLLATARALMDLGWIEKAEIPPDRVKQTKDLWNWLATETRSNFLEFVKDAFYSDEWNESLRKQTSAEIIKRLNEKNDIDLMIAAGTWAGKDLATNDHHANTIVISTSEPVASGIIKSIEDSGYDHVLARVNPSRYERQIRIFHDIIGFKKLGMAYADTEPGRTYAALDKVNAAAQERGFEIISCYTKDDIPDAKLAAESVAQCFHELGKKADAIYVTKQNGVTPESIPELVKIVNSYRIPTFSQSGSEEVKLGFLLSISLAGFKYDGRFYAETIAKILNGAKPRQLSQIFESPPKVAINLKTAEIIGFDPPVDVLGAADEIFQEIAMP